MAKCNTYGMLVLVLGAALWLATTPAAAQDPASSWMAYAVSKGHGKRITYLNATWTVPSYPSERVSGSAPGWWWGIEPEPALDLIQPILAWGDGPPMFTIFNGYFQWDNSDWWQSQGQVVNPGDKITSFVQYTANNDSYTMQIGSGGWSVTSSIGCENGKIFTDAYFVFEHQPQSCATLPTDGIVTFTDIHIELDGVPVANPEWSTHVEVPACGSKAHVVSPTSLSLTWDPNSNDAPLGPKKWGK